MTFCIITHVPHNNSNRKFFAYAPYVYEMNIWLKYVNEVIVVAPIEEKLPSVIDLEYTHSKINFFPISNINLLNFKSVLKSILKIPSIAFQIYKAMKRSDHIHLRCPGNIGMIGCIVQIFFPNKLKTAKYAGNWDPKSKQPWSYKLQRWILSNTFLTRNMQVLVYGEWENQTKNIKPFFTATYSESDKLPILNRKFDNTISFLFVGTLSKGKRPLYAIQLVENVRKLDFNVNLSIFGQGEELDKIQEYICQNNLESFIILKGNQSKEIVKKAYQQSHFLILPSKSEGWPKVVAEAMFWGCLPISTSVSCVPTMVNEGERGMLLKMSLEKDVEQIKTILKNQMKYESKVQASVEWSRKYTLDLFENEIKTLLQP